MCKSVQKNHRTVQNRTVQISFYLLTDPKISKIRTNPKKSHCANIILYTNWSENFKNSHYSKKNHCASITNPHWLVLQEHKDTLLNSTNLHNTVCICPIILPLFILRMLVAAAAAQHSHNPARRSYFAGSWLLKSLWHLFNMSSRTQKCYFFD